MHAAGHAALAPLHKNAPQVGLPAEPADTLAQVPSLTAPAATEHASHEPAHALLQHTPSEQWIDVHSWLPAHAVPLVLSAWQLVPLQKSPAAHWVSSVQLEGQLPDAPLHTYGVQLGDAPAEPEAVKVHVPGVTLHTSQPPAHAEPQQKPSWQNALAQEAVPPAPGPAWTTSVGGEA